MNKLNFADLDTKLLHGETMAIRHNMTADELGKQGRYIPRYDLLEVKRSILKAHRKFYGGLSKYASDGTLR